MNEQTGAVIPLVMFVAGLAAVVVGGAWGAWWRARHWNDAYFSVQRLPDEIRLSYGMGLGPLAVMVFGFTTFVASVVLLMIVNRWGSASGGAALLLAVVTITLVTALASFAIRARRKSGKDDIVIDRARLLLLVPGYARPDGTSAILAIDALDELYVQVVERRQGSRGSIIDNRVMARVHGASTPIVLAASLTQPAARGMADEIGRLLSEVNPRHRVLVDPETKKWAGASAQ